MKRPFSNALAGLLLPALLGACQSSTLPTAKTLTEYTRVFRERAQPEFDELERRRASGELSEADYVAAKKALEDRAVTQARDAAWARHSLAESEREALGIPTPGRQVAIDAPNPMLGGAGLGMGGNIGGAGTLYRPFTQLSQGVWGDTSGRSLIPRNSGNVLTPNAGSVYDPQMSPTARSRRAQQQQPAYSPEEEFTAPPP